MTDISKRLPRLKTVERQSAVRVREVAIRVESLRQQHDQLSVYRAEYQATNAVVPALIMDAQCFIERLDRSIEQVAQALYRQQRLLEMEHNRWLSDRARVKALELLCERKRMEVRRESHKNERRVADSLLVYKQLKTARKSS